MERDPALAATVKEEQIGESGEIGLQGDGKEGYLGSEMTTVKNQ